jgi:hypothetical protein
MTMIAGCHFENGAIIIADSRITWETGKNRILNDFAQKILPIASKGAIAFAGHVVLADWIIRQIKKRLSKDARHNLYATLAPFMVRVARKSYEEYKKRIDSDASISLILAGVDLTGKYSMYACSSPTFQLRKIKGGFAVFGSGAVVYPYIKNKYLDISKESIPLKDRADKLLPGLESELGKSGVDTVGGLFQTILIDDGGIRPYHYRFMDINPEGPAFGMEMEFKSGRWMQTDLTNSKSIELVVPAKVLSTRPIEGRFYNYERPTDLKQTPNWYLSHFITCLQVNKADEKTEFQGVMSQIGSHHYPREVIIVASVGLWGSNGKNDVSFRLDDGNSYTTIHNHSIDIKYYPESIDFETPLRFRIEKPGPVFIDCFINDKFLGRKALYFGLIPLPPAKNQEESKNIATYCREHLMVEHQKHHDKILQQKNAIIDFISICEKFEAEECKYTFYHEPRAVYWKSYPLQFRMTIVVGLRLVKGKHQMRVDLINAATRETVELGQLNNVETSSECITLPTYLDALTQVSKPGIYFFNVYVDNQFVGSAVFAFETDKPQYFYSLLDEDVARVSSGEYIMLSKRSRQKRSEIIG